MVVLAPLDALFWGAVRLPSFTAPAATTVLVASAATPLSVVSLLLGIVAYRAGGADGGAAGWCASAVAHMVGNLAATSLALASGLS